MSLNFETIVYTSYSKSILRDYNWISRLWVNEKDGRKKRKLYCETITLGLSVADLRPERWIIDPESEIFHNSQWFERLIVNSEPERSLILTLFNVIQAE